MSRIPNSTKQDMIDTLQDPKKKNYLQVYFSHRTNNSYSLFNELRILKHKPNPNLSGQISFQATNHKNCSIEKDKEKGLNNPLSLIEKKLKSKIKHSVEVNLNEEHNKSAMLNYSLNSKKKSIHRNLPPSISKGVKNEEKELKLLYNSIDIRNDDLKKYWTNQKKASNSMIYVPFKEGHNNSGIKGGSIAPSSGNIFKRLDFKEKNESDNNNSHGIGDKETHSLNRGVMQYRKLFAKVQSNRNCVSHSKRINVRQSLNNNRVNMSQLKKADVINIMQKRQMSQSGNRSNLMNSDNNICMIEKAPNNSLEQKEHADYEDHAELFSEEEAESNLNAIEKERRVEIVDDLNDLMSPNDEDEKISPLSHLPIFASKKLSYYHSYQLTEKKIQRRFSNDTVFTSFFQFLKAKDAISLSLTCTYFERRTRAYRYSLIITRVIPHDKLNISSSDIWLSLRQYSQLSQVPYLKKTYLDNAFKHSNYLPEIKKDIIRTYPSDSSFNESSPLYKQLLYILNAYANYNPQIGYAQGMNFILAKILSKIPNDEEALLCLDAIMNRLHMESVVGLSNQLVTSMNCIGELISKALPEFDLFLKKHSLSHEVFTANWIITLFASSTDNEELYVIWDFIVIFGWKFIYCFIIAIIKSFEERIVHMKFDNYSEEIRLILRSERFKIQFRSIIALSLDYMSKSDGFATLKRLAQ